MDGYKRSVAENIAAAARGSHEAGQPLRDFFWQIRAHGDVRERVRAGLLAVGNELRIFDAEPFMVAPVFDDEMLGLGSRLRREWHASEALLRGACATGQSRCDTMAARLGVFDDAQMKTLIDNSPTAIRSGGRTLPSGEVVRFVKNEATIEKMVVTLNGVSREYTKPEPIREGSKLLGLEFVGTEQTKRMWSVEGRLVVR